MPTMILTATEMSGLARETLQRLDSRIREVLTADGYPVDETIVTRLIVQTMTVVGRAVLEVVQAEQEEQKKYGV